MKYEIYKTLSEEQKKEYNYRFKDNPIVISIQGISLFTLVIFMNWSFVALLMYVITKAKDTLEFSDTTIDVIRDMFVSLTKAHTIYYTIVIAFISGWLWSYGWRRWKLHKWAKKENLDIKWWKL